MCCGCLKDLCPSCACPQLRPCALLLGGIEFPAPEIVSILTVTPSPGVLYPVPQFTCVFSASVWTKPFSVAGGKALGEVGLCGESPGLATALLPNCWFGKQASRGSLVFLGPHQGCAGGSFHLFGGSRFSSPPLHLHFESLWGAVSSKRGARAFAALAAGTSPPCAGTQPVCRRHLATPDPEKQRVTSVVEQLLGSGYQTGLRFFFPKTLLITHLEICFVAGRRPSFTG